MSVTLSSGDGRPSKHPVERFLTCYIGEVFYALRQVAIQEVLPLADGPVPSSIPSGGSTYPVVDPYALFALADIPPVERQVILYSTTQRTCAVIVDRVEDLLWIDPRRFQAIPWHFGGREQLWFEGTAALDSARSLVLLNPQGLLASYGPAQSKSTGGEP